MFRWCHDAARSARKICKCVLPGLCLLALSTPGWADGLGALEVFVRDVRTVQGRFTQVVTSPARVGETVGRKKTSSGRFALIRPGQFRLEYTKPYSQLIVGDGAKLWLYDPDLDQLTQRAMRDVLSESPLSILSGAGMQAIRKYYQLKNIPDRDGLQWVQASSVSADVNVETIAIGFDPAHEGRLSTLIITDRQGQVLQMQLEDLSYQSMTKESLLKGLKVAKP